MAESTSNFVSRTVKTFIVALLIRLPRSRSAPLARVITRVWSGFREA
jgi:hypothetical protein